MRISDWSSDVCSSDLQRDCSALPNPRQVPQDFVGVVNGRRHQLGCFIARVTEHQPLVAGSLAVPVSGVDPACDVGRLGVDAHIHLRSEEHTSELQSLMRISYAVFCLKKNKTKQHT